MDQKHLEPLLIFQDGRIAFDAANLAAIPTEGISLDQYTNHVIVVRTKNTEYVFTNKDGKIRGQAYKASGIPSYLHRPDDVTIHGSTFGGSMLKCRYIGVGMHLEFSTEQYPCVTTTRIQSVSVARIEMLLPAESAK